MLPSEPWLGPLRMLNDRFWLSTSVATSVMALAVSSFVVTLWLCATGGVLTLVLAVAVLLPGVLSLGDETVAVLVKIVPAVVGAVTVMIIFGATPTARLPPVRLQV